MISNFNLPFSACLAREVLTEDSVSCYWRQSYTCTLKVTLGVGQGAPVVTGRQKGDVEEHFA
jgi:hypothetical protein